MSRNVRRLRFLSDIVMNAGRFVDGLMKRLCRQKLQAGLSGNRDFLCFVRRCSRLRSACLGTEPFIFRGVFARRDIMRSHPVRDVVSVAGIAVAFAMVPLPSYATAIPGGTTSSDDLLVNFDLTT